MFDIENHQELISYLKACGLLEDGRQPVCENLRGGVSNRAVLVRLDQKSGWVVKQALEKLRVKEDWFADPQRIYREAEGLRWLARLTQPGSIPGFIHEDRNRYLLIMEAVAEPHRNYKTVLMEHPPEVIHAGRFAELLADIHINSHKKEAQVAPVFRDSSFFESLRLDPYYAFSAGQLPEAAPFLLSLIERTRTRKLALVHGDYSPKNILLKNEHLVLLDHEVIHFGDPAFDIGFAMAHFLSKAHYHSSLRPQFIHVTHHFWQTYHTRTLAAPWAAELEKHCIAHSLACLLARVVGKSPLEYLTPDHKVVQKTVVLGLIRNNPRTMNSLIDRFAELVNKNEHY